MLRFPATLGVILASLLLLAAPTSAQEQMNVAVMGFGGATGAKVRQSVVSAMGTRKEINVVPLSDVRAAEERLGVSVENSAGAQKVGREQRIVAFIDGNAGRRGRAWTASIELRSGASGEVVKSAFFRDRTLSGLQRKVRFGTWGALRGPLQTAAGQDFAAEDESQKDDEDAAGDDDWEESDDWEEGDDWEEAPAEANGDGEEEQDDPRSDASTPDLMPMMRASLGFTGLLRSLSFAYQEGDLSPSSFGTLGLGFRLQLHPIENLGVLLNGATIFPISSGDADGTLSYPTSSGHLLVAAHARFSLDDVVAGVALGFEHRETIIAAAGPAPPQANTAAPVPSVSYDAIRLGADLRLAVASLLLEFHGALLFPLGLGSIDDPVWMREAGAFGFNIGAELDLPVDEGWSFVAGADLDLFLLSAGAVETSDAFPDASASDLYLSLYVGAGFTI